MDNAVIKAKKQHAAETPYGAFIRSKLAAAIRSGTKIGIPLRMVESIVRLFRMR